MRYVLFSFAAVCAVFALLMWLTFLRPAVTKTAQGVITYKIFKPAGQYVQYPSATSGGFYTPSVIPTAECFVFIIQVNQIPAAVGYSLNAIASQKFEVGQSVTIEYQERGLAGIWRRIYVTGMSR